MGQDVNSFADFWSWMNKGFIPLTMQSQHATSESSGLSIGDLSRRDRKRYLWHHLTVGPTKLSQGLADEIRCPNEHVANVYSIKCTTERGIDLEQHPVKIQAEQGSFVEDIPKTRWLYNASQASTLLAQLEAERWLDQRTNHIKVSKMTYNAASDLLLTTHVNFFFGRSGRIWKLLSHEAMRLKPYQDIASYVWDVLFYTQVCILRVVCFVWAPTHRTRSGVPCRSLARVTSGTCEAAPSHRALHRTCSGTLGSNSRPASLTEGSRSQRWADFDFGEIIYLSISTLLPLAVDAEAASCRPKSVLG